jgi:D-aminoacyl-tRNA deacylase
MRAVVQRVSRAAVRVDGRVVGRCGVGLLLLVAAHRDDTQAEAAKLADRVAGLRIFNDAEGKMNLALADLDSALEAGVLAVSNFTVYGNTAKNRRPSFVESAPYERGKELFERFVAELAARGVRVETGVFGAHMEVEMVNDGPVTVLLDAPPREPI